MSPGDWMIKGMVCAARREGYRLGSGREERRRLEEARRSIPFTPDPLVTVRIATYQNSEKLIERTIPSVLSQTYQDFELVIIGDGCSPPHTERITKHLEELNDPRIRFENLPQRGAYPDDPQHRWYVAGSIPANRGIEVARGEWIAPLDDDDGFTPDHIEALLRFAQANGHELVYSKVLMERSPDLWEELGSYPLRSSQVSHLSVMYHRRLAHFRYDVESWKCEEPCDWNMWRRMMEAGARIGFLPRVTGTHYLEGTRRGV